MELGGTLVAPSDLQQLRDQLPESEDDENWRKLFAVIDAGGRGEVQKGGVPQPVDAPGGSPRASEGISPTSQSAQFFLPSLRVPRRVRPDTVPDGRERAVGTRAAGRGSQPVAVAVDAPQ
jgi:hypothetical protein